MGSALAEERARYMRAPYGRVCFAFLLSGLFHVLAFMPGFDIDSFNVQHVVRQWRAMSVILAKSATNEAPHARHSSHMAEMAVTHHATSIAMREAAQTLNDSLAPPAVHVDEPYYTLDMLDRPAQPMAELDIASTLLPSIRTRLLLEFWIDRNGDVRKLLVIEPAGAQDDMKAIIDSLRTARFSPAIRDHRQVNSRKLVELAIDGADMLAAR